jgi:ATP-dependent exoDNAse (exonuclease V) alpha subunit
VLVTRNDLTKADRKIASRYHVGDWVRFAQNSPARGIKAGDYARVTEVRAGANQLRLKREGWGKLKYDPKRLCGVTVYQEGERTFSVGDRVQFTAPERFEVAGKKTTIANRARGTVEDIGRKGKLTIAMDTGKTVTVDAFRQKHLDHGYAVTSHSSQGLTADRTILAIDTDHASEMLVNQRMGYVGGSRPRDYLAVSCLVGCFR